LQVLKFLVKWHSCGCFLMSPRQLNKQNCSLTCVLRHLTVYFHCAKNFNQQTRSQQYIIMRQNHRQSLDLSSVILGASVQQALKLANLWLFLLAAYIWTESLKCAVDIFALQLYSHPGPRRLVLIVLKSVKIYTRKIRVLFYSSSNFVCFLKK